jgi:hypothetical protein
MYVPGRVGVAVRVFRSIPLLRRPRSTQDGGPLRLLEAAVQSSQPTAVRWLLGRPEVAGMDAHVTASLPGALRRAVERRTVGALACLHQLVSHLHACGSHAVVSLGSLDGVLGHLRDLGGDAVSSGGCPRPVETALGKLQLAWRAYLSIWWEGINCVFSDTRSGNPVPGEGDC